jgi:hypothetical protein
MPNVHRAYCFTWFPPGGIPDDPSDAAAIAAAGERVPQLGDGVRYVCWQIERCPDTGRVHLQGYAELRRGMRVRGFQRAIGLPGAHVEVRRGTRDQARDYTRKEDASAVPGTWTELGSWIGGRGTRSDLDAVAQSIRDGVGLEDVCLEHTGMFIKYHAGIERALAILQPPPQREEPKVFVIYGSTGVGKSRAVNSLFDGAFWWPRPVNGNAYASGYSGQSVAVFDDFYSWIPYDLCLRVCDRYPLSVNVMGGSANFMASTIIFTSNQSPDEWYPRVADKSALMRRLEHRLHVTQMDSHEAIAKWIEDRL